MNLQTPLRISLVPALVLALAACGGPAQDPQPAASPDPVEDPARPDAATGDTALREPADRASDPREPRGGEPARASERPAAAAGGGFAEGHPVPDAARPLLGEWIVTGHRFGAVAAMDDAAAARLHGREVSFGDSHANSGADSCASPRYSVEQRNVVESLLVDHRTTPAALGLDQATDAQVTVIDVACATPWVTLGSRILVLPDGLVLAPWDGVFFELQPR